MLTNKYREQSRRLDIEIWFLVAAAIVILVSVMIVRDYIELRGRVAALEAEVIKQAEKTSKGKEANHGRR